MPSVSVCLHVSASVPDFVYMIFPTVFSLMAFKFSDMVTVDKTLNRLTFCDRGSIFKVTGGQLCLKINFVYAIFPVVLY